MNFPNSAHSRSIDERGWGGGTDDAVLRALASHQFGLGSISAQCHMWIEFAVGSRYVPRFFFRFSEENHFTQTKISTFKFDVDPMGGPHETQLRWMWLSLKIVNNYSPKWK